MEDNIRVVGVIGMIMTYSIGTFFMKFYIAGDKLTVHLDASVMKIGSPFKSIMDTE